MNRARLVWLAIISVLFVSLLNAADALKPVALSSVAADPQAEKLLLEMANEARAKAGLAPLRKDEGLAEAARAHPSPPHRENLLDPVYNISGFGVVRSGHLLYVTQDFGRGVTTYSAEKSEQLIARNIVDARHRSRLVRLRELDGTSARDAAWPAKTPSKPTSLAR
jgi:hypothetical protein